MAAGQCPPRHAVAARATESGVQVDSSIATPLTC